MYFVRLLAIATAAQSGAVRLRLIRCMRAQCSGEQWKDTALEPASWMNVLVERRSGPAISTAPDARLRRLGGYPRPLTHPVYLQ